MQERFNLKLSTVAILGMIAIGLHVSLVAVPFLQAGPAVWIEDSLPDDAYYYFQCSWNYVRGCGMSMDGIEESNGFHPLWMAFCCGLAKSTDFKEAMVLRAMLLLAMVFYVSACLTAIWLTKLLRSNLVGLTAVSTYLAIPELFLMHMNGLETGFVLLFSTATLLALTFLLRKSRPSSINIMTVGILSGLTLLSRTDTLFFCGVVGAIVLALSLRSQLVQSPYRMRSILLVASRSAMCFVVPILLLLVPWMLWSLSRFGSIVQDSGYIVPFERWTNRDFYFSGDVSTWLDFWQRHVTLQFVQPFQKYILGIGFYNFLLFGILSIFALASLRNRSVLIRWSVVVSPLIISLATLASIHTCVRLMPRPWYFVSAQQLAVIGISSIAYVLLHSPLLTARRSPLMIVLVVLAIISNSGHTYSGMRADGQGFWPWQTKLLHGDSYYETLRNAGISTLGDTDGGIATFYAPSDFKVVNLDGKINRSAALAITSGTLFSYILESDVQVVRIRTSLGDTTAIMGRDDFRGYFAPIEYVTSRYTARVLRKQEDVHTNIQLPTSASIYPGQDSDWKYLLGDWQYWKPPGATGMAVARPGIQFYLPQHLEIPHITIRMRAPFEGQQLSVNVLLNEQLLEEILVDPVMRDYEVEVPTGHLSVGVHRLVLGAPEAKSAVDLRLGRSSERIALIVERFSF